MSKCTQCAQVGVWSTLLVMEKWRLWLSGVPGSLLDSFTDVDGMKLVARSIHDLIERGGDNDARGSYRKTKRGSYRQTKRSLMAMKSRIEEVVARIEHCDEQGYSGKCAYDHICRKCDKRTAVPKCYEPKCSACEYAEKRRKA